MDSRGAGVTYFGLSIVKRRDRRAFVTPGGAPGARVLRVTNSPQSTPSMGTYLRNRASTSLRMSPRHRQLDRQDRARRQAHDLLGDAAHQQALQAGAAVAAEH